MFKQKANEVMNDKIVMLNNYINKSEVLVRILERETQFFKENQASKVVALNETKEKYIDEIEGIKTLLIADGVFLKSLPAETKSKIMEVSNALKKAAEENYREVVIAKEVNKLVLEAIYQAAAEHHSEAKGYSNSGTMYAEYKQSRPVAVSEQA